MENKATLGHETQMFCLFHTYYNMFKQLSISQYIKYIYDNYNKYNI